MHIASHTFISNSHTKIGKSIYNISMIGHRQLLTIDALYWLSLASKRVPNHSFFSWTGINKAPIPKSKAIIQITTGMSKKKKKTGQLVETVTGLLLSLREARGSGFVSRLESWSMDWFFSSSSRTLACRMWMCGRCSVLTRYPGQGPPSLASLRGR